MFNTDIADATERLRALDPRESFIVQAPAGSGKTELLIQRFLLLLGTVKYPEEILAMTFTRKAAAEMRARIILALQFARDNPEPHLPHAKKTWELARIVLQQDEKYHWQLLSCPTRLRIQTLDSFNHFLTRQLPILSRFGATPELTEEADSLYRAAISEILSHLEENVAWSDAIAILLLHRDNNLEKVTELLESLLARRDQWLPDITQNTEHTHLREYLEQHLVDINNDILKKLQNNFPKNHTDELFTLAEFATNNLNLPSNNAHWRGEGSLVKIERKTWLNLAELLLTKNNEWRKRFDKNTGFPADKNLTPMKQRMHDLMQQLISHDEFKSALIELRNAPDTKYSDQQWQTLSALHDVLRIAVAQLKVIFMEHGKIDYTENALAALIALGTENAPTDLTLALDNQIRHILVDEFQDTSNTQYQLLKKITVGWEARDGRTLFLVGDPMQSIYLFREAEVGLFIRTRQRGLGHLPLQPLTLSVNFRSTSHIVNWVNAHFPKIFPAKDDIASAAVTYCQSTTMQHNNVDTQQSSVRFISEKAESRGWQGKKIVEIVQQRQQEYPDETIAILVRSRSHLQDIMPALRNACIPYRAIDIDPLSERPIIQDLLALTRAILNPADRIAWLAILRAPWCGLILSDLLKITDKNSNTAIWQQLKSHSVIQSLSIDGQKRIARVFPILSVAVSSRARLSLVDTIESTWRLLGGPATLPTLNDLQDATTYFKLLNTLSHSNTQLDADKLEQSVAKLFATPHADADERLQIMTIHNSKGLEFDTVILPHLEKQTAHDDRELLAWMERTGSENTSAFIMAPIQATGAPSDSVYEYIRCQNELRTEHEKCRLLYVAITRTKQNLFLLFNQPENNKAASGSLLGKLWPAINNNITLSSSAIVNNHFEEKQVSSFFLRRLNADWKNPLIEIHSRDPIHFHQTVTGFMLPDYSPRHTGTLIHQIIQQICLQGENWWHNQTQIHKNIWLKNALQNLGFNHLELDPIVQNIQHAIQTLLNDERGRWIIAPHTAAQSEYRLTTLIDAEPQQMIIDRTFIDEKGLRWIIDFKTSHNTSGTVEEFVEKEKKKYEKQLQNYATAMRSLDDRPICLGLYFPMLPTWHAWAL